MEIQTIVKVLRHKIHAMKESGPGEIHPDLQAFSEAKVSLLEDLIALAPSYIGLKDFNDAISQEISEVALSQRISRNAFLVAAMRVKLGILQEVQAILPAPNIPAPRKSAMFVNA